MKSISIYAVTRNQNIGQLQKLERQLSGREYFLKMRTWELESMRSLVRELEAHMDEVYALRFFYSFQIPRLGKEFDLLQIKDEQIVNIELKSGVVSDETIRKQLIQNRYYLSVLGRPIYSYTYISSQNRLVRLTNHDHIVEADWQQLCGLLKNKSSDYGGEIEDLFQAEMYLISPLTEPLKFLRKEYFLTSQQRDIKRQILKRIRTEHTGYYSFSGLPGTGKTLLAKAVAGEAHVPFFSLSGSDFVEMFVGVGASRVRDLFEEAKKNAPCIIFIDEIDAIGKSRDSRYGGGNDEREQTLNQLLAEMDGFDSSKGILILAATNRPEILDPALLRPGRFDRRVIVERPDLKGRVNILKVHAKDVSLDETVDLDAIALATSGAVGSDLANMINEAAILAVKNGRKAVSQKDLYEAVEVVLVGKEKKDRILSQEERRIVSYHEVGHALVSALQKDAEPVQKITIVPRTMGALGYVMQVPEEEKYLNTKAELEAMLVGLLGGRAAEEVVFGNVTTGASNDIEKATQIAKAMITQYGMSEKFGLMGLASVEHEYLNGRATLNCGDATATEIDHEVMKMLKESYEQAKQMFCEHRKTLDKIAAFLIERETITGKEFMEIFHEAEGIEGKEPEPAETAVEATPETPDAEPMTEAALQEEEVTADPVSDTPEEKKVQESVKEDSQE